MTDVSAFSGTLYTYATAPQHPALKARGISRRQLTRWVPAGKAPHENIEGRIFFKESDLLALVASFDRPVTSTIAPGADE